MALPLIPPEAQFVDQNGHPYAGGTITTFVPGTDTPSDTWKDMDGTALNTNPVVLDAAGRALLYGSGEYRFVLRDALGNLIYDQLTSSFISTAMQPVVSADTIADARDLLGIDDAIASEASARSAADSAEATARTNADNAEITARTNADTTLQTNIDAEKTRAEAAEANLQTQISGGSGTVFRVGSGTTDGSGMGGVTFSPAFPTSCDSVVMTLGAIGINSTIRATGVSASGCTAQVEDTNNTGGVAGAPFYYIAAGH